MRVGGWAASLSGLSNKLLIRRGSFLFCVVSGRCNDLAVFRSEKFGEKIIFFLWKKSVRNGS